jgi:hypothetical protein
LIFEKEAKKMMDLEKVLCSSVRTRAIARAIRRLQGFG